MEMIEVHVIIQRGPFDYEIWRPCTDRGCNVHHTKIASCDDRFEAERIVRSLDKNL